MKTCPCCGIQKPVDQYYKNKRQKDGLSSYCKICHTAEGKKRYSKEASLESYYRNRERALRSQQKYYQKNKTEIVQKRNNPAHKEKKTEYMKAYHKEWYQRNRHKKLKQNSEWIKKQEQKDVSFKLRRRLRSRLACAIRRQTNGSKVRKGSILDLVGCSLIDLKTHLESQFKPGMSWKNYGSVWHIDHIKPCALFDLTVLEQQAVCFNYSNLQPLFVEENLKKHKKYPYDYYYTQ